MSETHELRERREGECIYLIECENYDKYEAPRTNYRIAPDPWVFRRHRETQSTHLTVMNWFPRILHCSFQEPMRLQSA